MRCASESTAPSSIAGPEGEGELGAVEGESEPARFDFTEGVLVRMFEARGAVLAGEACPAARVLDARADVRGALEAAFDDEGRPFARALEVRGVMARPCDVATFDFEAADCARWSVVLAARAMAARAMAVSMVRRLRGSHAAAQSRRLEDWRAITDTGATDPAMHLATIRARSRELRRNNPYWESAITGIVGHTVGHGILAAVSHPRRTAAARLQAEWNAWAKSKVADASGRMNLYALQSLVMETDVESGECLVRRFFDSAGALRLMVLSPDYLATVDSYADIIPITRKLIIDHEIDLLGPLSRQRGRSRRRIVRSSGSSSPAIRPRPTA
jgi:hypothetical protein